MRYLVFLHLVLSGLLAGQGVGQGFTPSLGASSTGAEDSTYLRDGRFLEYFKNGVKIGEDTVLATPIDSITRRVAANTQRLLTSDYSGALAAKLTAAANRATELGVREVLVDTSGSTVGFNTRQNIDVYLLSEDSKVVGGNYEYRTHLATSPRPAIMPPNYIRADRMQTFLQSSTKRVVAAGTSLWTGRVGHHPLDNHTSKLELVLRQRWGEIDFRRRGIGATNATHMFTVFGPSGGAGSFDPASTEYAWADTDQTLLQHLKEESPELIFMGWSMNDNGTGNPHRAYYRILDSMATWSPVPDIILVNSVSSTLSDDFNVLDFASQNRVNESSDFLRGLAATHPMIAGIIDVNRIGQIMLQGIDPCAPVYEYPHEVLDDVPAPSTGTAITTSTLAKDFYLRFETDWTDAVNRYIRIGLGGENDEIQIYPYANPPRVVFFSQSLPSRTIALPYSTTALRGPAVWEVSREATRTKISREGIVLIDDFGFVPIEPGYYPVRLGSTATSAMNVGFTNVEFIGARGLDFLPSISYTEAFGLGNQNTQQPKAPFGGNGGNHFSSKVYAAIYQMAYENTIWPW